MKNMRTKILHDLEVMTSLEGHTQTHLPDVTLFRADRYTARKPFIYDQCFCIVLQGYKKCFLRDNVLIYGAEQYLVVPTVLPAEAEVFPEEGRPLLGVTIAIDHAIVHELVSIMGNGHFSEPRDMPPLASTPLISGGYLEVLTGHVLEPVARLLQSLDTREDAEIVGRQAVREIHYRALRGEHGHILASVAMGESAYARISKVLRDIHDNYAASMDVPGLASEANMSIRAFHRHFKAITSNTPVQYVKRIRLEKARMLLVNQQEPASAVAHMVGYESPSQFSREFKRHFGYSPRDARERDEQGLGACPVNCGISTQGMADNFK